MPENPYTSRDSDICEMPPTNCKYPGFSWRLYETVYPIVIRTPPTSYIRFGSHNSIGRIYAKCKTKITSSWMSIGTMLSCFFFKTASSKLKQGEHSALPQQSGKAPPVPDHSKTAMADLNPALLTHHIIPSIRIPSMGQSFEMNKPRRNTPSIIHFIISKNRTL